MVLAQNADERKAIIDSVNAENLRRLSAELQADFERQEVLVLAYLKKLERKKPVVFCGDLNVAHTEIDLANPKANMKNHGFTPEERAGFSALVQAGFVDSFREFEKRGGHYTWWSPMAGARSRNVGWRLDYFLVSAALRPKLRRAFIRPEVSGSDHCPVGIEVREG